MTGRSASIRGAAALLLASALFAQHTRPSPAATSQPASAPPLELADFTQQPIIDESERDVPRLRIASASPSITELCCALGLREWLVARTQYCTHPPGLEALPSIGALTETNVETLLALRPDVVLLTDCSNAIRERLAPFKLRLVEMPVVKMDDLFTSIERLGDVAGRPKSARRLAAAVREQIAVVAAAHAGAAARHTLIVTDALTDPPAPPFVAGNASFYDDLLRSAGHRNAAPGGSPFAPISLEYIVRTDPDVIIEIDADGASRRKGDADAIAVWRKIGPLSAVREQRVHVLIGPQHFLLGPRIATTMNELLERIEPRAARLPNQTAGRPNASP
ncbi:MAG: ABC transporter substrate-binding protein [Phycisphaerales bacterium]|nr:ABC transporter substrate-binding protein [Phycisphaerales bacterium]